MLGSQSILVTGATAGIGAATAAALLAAGHEVLLHGRTQAAAQAAAAHDTLLQDRVWERLSDISGAVWETGV